MIDGTLSVDALVQAGAALMVGAAHFALIWVGLRQMRRSSEERNRQMDEMERTARERHTESMEALKELITRTAPQRS